MNKKTTKFDALAYAVSKLGQPHDISEDRTIEESYGLVADVHLWELPKERRWLAVHEWSDGDQGTSGRTVITYLGGALRNNGDGTLCAEYEEQARALIDAYSEAVK